MVFELEVLAQAILHRLGLRELRAAERSRRGGGRDVAWRSGAGSPWLLECFYEVFIYN